MYQTDTRIYPFTVAPGGVVRIPVSGYKFTIQSTSAPVDVRWSDGFLSLLQSGHGYNVKQGFAWLVLTNSGLLTATGTVLIATDEFINNRISGEVAVNSGATLVQGNPAVGIASSVLVPANPVRKYLLIQNNHPTSALYLGFDVPAIIGSAIRLAAGGGYESGIVVHQGAINALSDTVNANVVVLEG